MARTTRDLKPRKPPEDFQASDEAEDRRAPPPRQERKKATKTATADVPEEDDSKKYFGEEDDDADPMTEVKSKRREPGEESPRYVAMDKDSGRRSVTKLDKHKSQSRSRLTDSLIKHMIAAQRKKFGNSAVFVGKETDKLIVGIPMFAGHGETGLRYPGCLALEFVIGMDIFPLSLVIQLVAKTGVGKSGMLAEFGRWFHMAGGYFNLCEAETKFNPEWYRSIMGEKVFDEEVILDRCDSVEQWQRMTTFAIQEAKRFMDGTKSEPGPGRTFPWLFGVDSIMGKSSEKTQEGILGKKTKDGARGTTGEGAAGRGFPIEALIISRYMRSIPAELDNWPFAMVMVNHLRIKTDDMGNEERSKAGGEQVGFQESFEIEMAKVGGHKKRIESRHFEGFPVQISCEKNSFGPTHRRIQTRCIWQDAKNQDTGKWEQKTFWDWDWSTIWLLNNILNSEHGSPRLRAALKEEVGFHLACPSVSDIENRAWSKNLGMKEKDAMSWAEVGALIRQDQKLLDELRAALRISRRPRLAGNYVQQLDELTKKMP